MMLNLIAPSNPNRSRPAFAANEGSLRFKLIFEAVPTPTFQSANGLGRLPILRKLLCFGVLLLNGQRAPPIRRL